MINICLVIPSMNSGGMERVMSELMNNFSKRENVVVNLVMYGRSPTIFYDISESIKVYTPDWEFDNTRRTWHTFRRMHFLRETVKRINPDTILSFGEFWNSFTLFGLLGLKYPIYISDRCQPDKSLGKLHDLLRNFLYPMAAGMIAQTKISKDIYASKGLNKRIEVIGNPIRHVEHDLSEKRERIVLSVGRLIATKQHKLLIDIFLKCNVPNWKLVIVGGDANQQNGMVSLKAKIKDLNVADRVFLAGSQSDVDSYYRVCSIFASTSSSEGFPNVIGEAMSAGLPMVAFDCVAGPSDLILDGETGFLVPLDNAKLFQTQLERLMKDVTLRNKMGFEASVRIKKNSPEFICDKYYNFIIGS